MIGNIRGDGRVTMNIWQAVTGQIVKAYGGIRGIFHRLALPSSDSSSVGNCNVTEVLRPFLHQQKWQCPVHFLNLASQS